MQFPADIMTNQIFEKQRGMHGMRHGSCGWGIYETSVRNKTMPVSVEEFARLDRPGRLACIREIAEYQLDARIRSLRRISYLAEIVNLFTSDGMAEHFADDFEFMYRNSRILPMDDMFFGGEYDAVVFENAQGLLLDETYSHDSIHSTPSMTGLNGTRHCIEKTCSREFDVSKYADSLIVNYVSRTYLTRHGEGPFREYDPTMHFEDKTNIFNDWQINIRFGRFDGRSCSEFEARTLLDFLKNAHWFKIADCSRNFVFTHRDEVEIPAQLRSLL